MRMAREAFGANSLSVEKEGGEGNDDSHVKWRQRQQAISGAIEWSSSAGVDRLVNASKDRNSRRLLMND